MEGQSRRLQGRAASKPGPGRTPGVTERRGGWEKGWSPVFGTFPPARLLHLARPGQLRPHLQVLQAGRRRQPGEAEGRVRQAVRAVGQAVQEPGHRGGVVAARVQAQGAGGRRRQQARRLVVGAGGGAGRGPGGLRGLRRCQGRQAAVRVARQVREGGGGVGRLAVGQRRLRIGRREVGRLEVGGRGRRVAERGRRPVGRWRQRRQTGPSGRGAQPVGALLEKERGALGDRPPAAHGGPAPQWARKGPAAVLPASRGPCGPFRLRCRGGRRFRRSPHPRAPTTHHGGVGVHQHGAGSGDSGGGALARRPAGGTRDGSLHSSRGSLGGGRGGPPNLNPAVCRVLKGGRPRASPWGRDAGQTGSDRTWKSRPAGAQRAPFSL